jgi:hypothetical protein
MQVLHGGRWRDVEVVGVTVDGQLRPATITASPSPYVPPAEPPTPPPSGDLGTVDSRPAVTVRPSLATTGPRQEPTQVMTGAQAMTAILAAPIEADGRRYLRRTRITGNLNLASTGSAALVFEDCVVDGGRTAIYTVSAFYQAGSTQPATWPEFRHCELRGGSSATLRGGWVRLLRCNLHWGTDILKPFHPMEVWACHLHDCYRGEGAHCDLIQIVSGVSGGLFHYNSFYGFTSADSPSDPSSWVSGNLQIGTITGPIGIPDPVRFIGNWVEGARYGLRGSGGASDNPDGHPVQTVFRGNRFIRGSHQFAPTGNLGPDDDFDISNVWDDDGTPVLA